MSTVLAEICDDGTKCSQAYYCCRAGCCFGSRDSIDDVNDRRYAYGYRLSIWNMWYFWFVVLFLMMMCFGGCGYYKQRQRLTARGLQGQGRPSFISIFQATRRQRRNMGHAPTPQSDLMMVYPDPVMSNSFAPPPYNEVVSHPSMFPPSTKTSYPSNAHNYLQGPTSFSESSVQMPQPPPYNEVANEGVSLAVSANQNLPNNSPANRNASQ
ncbi:vesicular, overexpressed in cancer, prosurvival protein 1-like isoform X2 [Dreissena polymorpha]|uniref:vesicular, overexpressed in cancer, prosurvival protein 1-like isoform X2 n=1 Tax=Dreissena polymorpha TaxID=45954 RepID=UPI002263F1CE|nr:vesicular, overexpressed in cancer, prosurvival protein 1-like isoform X2 [Dreissena polymorpha]